MDAPVSTSPATTAAARQQRQRRTWLIYLALALGVIALGTLAWWWLYASHYETREPNSLERDHRTPSRYNCQLINLYRHFLVM